MNEQEKLLKLIETAQNLIKQEVTNGYPEFKAWHTLTSAFLTDKYGKDNVRTKSFEDRIFWSGILLNDKTILETEACRNGLETTILELKGYLAEMCTVEEEAEINNSICSKNKIFVIHGHDGELKESVARLIEKQGIQAIILSEMANAGKTIIEKFEENSDVGAAIALFTGDDIGGKAGNENTRPRARQNVVFECGYFMGKLGRDKVMIITEKDVELPSDLQGIVWTNVNECKLAILKELDSMGFDIDLNVLKKSLRKE